jgi:peptidoglycan lytic transglycosylase
VASRRLSQVFSAIDLPTGNYGHNIRREPASVPRAVCGLAFLLAALAGCSHHNVPARPPSAPSNVPSNAPPGSAASGPPPAIERQPAVPGGYVEEGVASWYGVPFNGRRTSNGEIYDMHTFTAAHRTLPFNCVVRVTNLNNGKQTEVRINDRGPFVANRVIDLSLAAAQAIEMWGPGTANVRLEILSGPNPRIGFFAVQVGAFKVQENAQRFRAEMDAAYPPATVETYGAADGTYYRVRVGKLPSEDAAQKLADRLRSEGRSGALVVRVDD